MSTNLELSNTRVGVYIDVANTYQNGGQRMQFDIIRDFACRDNADPVRLNAYVSYDYRRAKKDANYRNSTLRFHSILREMGYKVIIKPVRWFKNEAGDSVWKANADLHLAVDVLLQSDKLDRVIIVSGDGDFDQVIRALQMKGCRVEVIALDNASWLLRQEADLFMSGYLIPDLIPVNQVTPHPERPKWGELGSRVRGWCNYYNHTGRGYGFFTYMKAIKPGLWITDDRLPNSPYQTIFFHVSELDRQFDFSILPNLPSRDYVFEFTIAENRRRKDDESNLIATKITLVSTLPNIGRVVDSSEEDTERVQMAEVKEGVQEDNPLKLQLDEARETVAALEKEYQKSERQKALNHKLG